MVAPSRKADHWPESYTQPCRHCGEPITHVRKGTGEPWRGSRDYWYTFVHSCPGRDAEKADMSAISDTLSR